MSNQAFAELEAKALSEGVSMDEQTPSDVDTKQGAKQAESPAAKSVESSKTQTDGSAKTVDEPSEKLPFHKDPEVQAYLNKMMTRKEREWDEKFRGINDEYTRRLELLNSNRVARGEPEITPDQQQKREAIKLLVGELMADPYARKELGLEEIKSLRDQFQSQTQEAQQEVFDSEMKGVVAKYVEKAGYDAEELEDNLREFMLNDPWFNGKNYQKGSIDKAAILYFSGKEKELAEREANLKLIKDKQVKKTNGVETTSKGQPSKNGVLERNLEDFLNRRVREGGGEITFE